MCREILLCFSIVVILVVTVGDTNQVITPEQEAAEKLIEECLLSVGIIADQRLGYALNMKMHKFYILLRVSLEESTT